MKKKIAITLTALGIAAANVLATAPVFAEANPSSVSPTLPIATTKAAEALKIADYSTTRLIVRYSEDVGSTWTGTFEEDGYRFVGTLLRGDYYYVDYYGRKVYEYSAVLNGYSKGPVVRNSLTSQQ